MSFPRYASYRDSGVAWLGEVPSHWSIRRVQDITRVVNGFPFDSTLFDPSVGMPLIRIRDLNADEAEVRTEEEYPPSAEITGADLLIGMDGDFNVGRWRGVKPALLNQRVCALRTSQSLISKILEYGLPQPLRLINELTYSTTVKHLSSYQVNAIRFPVPTDFSELETLVTFLDRETAKIDALVEAQRRLIALLKEKRQAVISHAVTKGLNPSAPMKPSGIDWLGDVPAHWDVKKLSSLAKLESGHTPSRQRPEYWIDEQCVVPWFTLADVGTLRSGKITEVADTSQRISEVGMANSAARLLPAGTVILSRTASVGFSAITLTAMALSQDFAAWICGSRLRPFFLLLVLRAMSPEFRRLMMGSTHQTIYMPDIEAFRIPTPPLAEQDAIIAHVISEKGRIETLTEQASASETLLTERRAALISAAVTGKIDVRGYIAEEVRNAVAAEIVHLHARDRTFGRVQNQKLIYLAQTHAGVSEIGGRFERKAAGPHDRALMSSIEDALKAEGVMQVSQPGGDDTKVFYTVARGTRPPRDRLRAMLGEDRLTKLDHVLNVLAAEDTRGVEAVATLYAVWNDALLDGETPDDDRLVRGFLKEWHSEKSEKFTGENVRNRIGFMRRNDLVPTGQGTRTLRGALL